jgi:hypothetical protein
MKADNELTLKAEKIRQILGRKPELIQHLDPLQQLVAKAILESGSIEKIGKTAAAKTGSGGSLPLASVK